MSVLLIFSSYQMVPTCTMYYPQPHPCFNWPWRASGPGHRWACTSIARLAILYAPNIVRDHVYFSLLARQVSWIMPPPHACYQGPETGIIRGSQLSITHFYDTFRRPCLGVWILNLLDLHLVASFFRWILTMFAWIANKNTCVSNVLNTKKMLKRFVQRV